MRLLNLRPYPVTIAGKEDNYDVKDAVAAILLNRALRLTAVQLLKNNALAQKVMGPNPELLLEEAEYATIRHACDQVEGYGAEDVELVQRILECPEVDVEVKP